MMDSFFRLHYCSVYEIYPQSEKPCVGYGSYVDSECKKKRAGIYFIPKSRVVRDLKK